MADGGTKVGSAYVEVTPKASGNFKSLVEKQMPNGTDGGSSFGEGFKGAAMGKIGALSVAMGNLLTDAARSAVGAAKAVIGDALSGFADYEQLTGGVETLMGTKGAKSVQEYADAVGKSVEQVRGEYEALSQVQTETLANAEGAFASAGMSTNDYMETVTGFAASLKAGLGEARLGELAAESDKAVSDMADNASKMGTDLGSIQDAYSGFAKQNFTMLDNLKLGYGGTKGEMERLLADAEKLPAAMGRKFDVDNFADVVDAIHIVQDEMGITGTTANEARETVSGSVAAMQGAWSNWVAALGRDDVDMGKMTSQLVEWVEIAAGNVLPRVTQVFSTLAAQLPGLVGSLLPVVLPAVSSLATTLGTTALTLLTSTVPQAIAGFGATAQQAVQSALGGLAGTATQVVGGLVSAVSALAPSLTSAVGGLLSGIVSAVPEVVSTLLAALPGMVATLGAGIVAEGQALIAAAEQLLGSLVQAIPAVIPALTSAIPQIVQSVVGVIVAGAPVLLQAGISLLGSIVQAIPTVVGQLLGALPGLIVAIVQSVVSAAPQLLAAAGQMFMSLVQGLAEVGPQLIGALLALPPMLVMTIVQGAPSLLQAGIDLFNAIGQGLSEVVPKIGEALTYFVTHLPEILWNGITGIAEGAAAMFGGFVDGITGNAPAAEQAAGDMAGGATQAALGSSDASAAGKNLTDSMLASFDFGSIEQATSAGVGQATADAAKGVDASAISEQIMASATNSLDTAHMDPPATEMANNAVDAALSVDSKVIGEQFSSGAASGMDVNAMSAKAAEMAAAAQGLNQTATVSVKADMSGVNQLQAGAASVQAAFKSMQGAASNSMAAVSRAASSAAPAYTRLASQISSSMRSSAAAASSAAASIRSSIGSIQGKTVHVNVDAGYTKLPHFSMHGNFDPKTGSVPSVSVSWYAKGGIFAPNDPQLIGIGDARVHEVVAPIDKLADMLNLDKRKGEGDVNVTLNYTNDADAERIALGIAREVKRYRMAGVM